MKKNLATRFLAAFGHAAAMSLSLILLLLAAASCRKTPAGPLVDPKNPAVQDLPGAAFTLTASENRYTDKPFPWTISKTGVTDSVREQIDQMYVTTYNVVTVTVTGDGAAYKGFNVASSNTDAVEIVSLSQDTFTLGYVKDGEADISVWNGSGSSEQKTTFHVTAQHEIFPKAVVFVLDEGTEREKEVRAEEWFIDEQDSFIRYYDGLINVHKPLDYRSLYDNGEWHVYVDGKEADGLSSPEVLHTLRYERVEPENTSFGTITFTSKRYNEFLNPKWLDYLKAQNLSTDWINEWTGNIVDLNKECFLFCGWELNGAHCSLCELSLRNQNPKGSSICQTALLLCIQHQFTWHIKY